MPYPIHLIPQKDYRILPIEELSLIERLCLIRFQRKKISLLPASGCIDPNSVEISTSQLGDLSNNLLGIFTIEDIYWGLYQVDGKMSPKYDYWDGKEECILPSEEECYKDETREFYFLLVDTINNIPFPDVVIKRDSKGNPIKTAQFIIKVSHTPTKCNFWHFSLRIYDDAGEDVEMLAMTKGEKRNVKLVIKNFLMDRILLSKEGIDFNTLPLKFFKSS